MNAEDVIGKRFAPHRYAVGREKVREYALAVGERDPLYLDPEAARAAGHRDVVAPPMFAVVYCSGAIGPAIFDPDIGIDFARMVHGSQEFRWGPLVVAGDEVTTTTTFGSVQRREVMAFFVFETESVNQHGEIVCSGTWTNIVRGG